MVINWLSTILILLIFCATPENQSIPTTTAEVMKLMIMTEQPKTSADRRTRFEGSSEALCQKKAYKILAQRATKIGVR